MSTSQAVRRESLSTQPLKQTSPNQKLLFAVLIILGATAIGVGVAGLSGALKNLGQINAIVLIGVGSAAEITALIIGLVKISQKNPIIISKPDVLPSPPATVKPLLEEKKEPAIVTPPPASSNSAISKPNVPSKLPELAKPAPENKEEQTVVSTPNSEEITKQQIADLRTKFLPSKLTIVDAEKWQKVNINVSQPSVPKGIIETLEKKEGEASTLLLIPSEMNSDLPTHWVLITEFETPSEVNSYNKLRKAIHDKGYEMPKLAEIRAWHRVVQAHMTEEFFYLIFGEFIYCVAQGACAYLHKKGKDPKRMRVREDQQFDNPPSSIYGVKRS